jgi:hypothetical protein
MGTPSVSAVKFLFAHSRNLCFFNLVEGEDRKTCEVHLTERGYDRCLGQIAHISSDRPAGPRYDSALSERDRQSETNLMLLCPNCHKRIDDLEPERFTVEVLQAMKERHLSRDTEGWKPDPEFVSSVAEDMVEFFLARFASPTSPTEDDDEDDVPHGVMGSSGVGYMSETVGQREARQMYVDAWRHGNTPETLERTRRANRRERRLDEVLQRHDLDGQVFLQYGDGDELTVTGAAVAPAVLEQLRVVGEFATVNDETR